MFGSEVERGRESIPGGVNGRQETSLYKETMENNNLAVLKLWWVPELPGKPGKNTETQVPTSLVLCAFMRSPRTNSDPHLGLRTTALRQSMTSRKWWDKGETRARG